MSRALTPDERADRLAARQHAAISLDQALACGLTPSQVRWRVKQGRWRRAALGTFTIAGAPPTWQQAVMVACLAGPAGTIASHLTAAALFGLWRPPPLTHVTVPAGASARLAVAKVHRSDINRSDITRVGAVPCTTPWRLLVECAELLGPTPLAEMVDEALVRQLATAANVVDTIARSARAPGRKGTRVLREVLAAWTPGVAPASPAEARLLRRIDEWGFRAPERQLVVRDAGGRFVARLDMGWPSRRVGLEYDGRRHHGPRRFEHDESRHARLVALGWRVGHVEKSDLLPGETWLREWLSRALGRAA